MDGFVEINLQYCREIYQQIKDKFPYLPKVRISIARGNCKRTTGGHGAHCHKQTGKICFRPATINQNSMRTKAMTTEEYNHYLKRLTIHETAHIRTKGHHGKEFQRKNKMYANSLGEQFTI